MLPNCLKDLCVKMPSTRTLLNLFPLYPPFFLLSAGASYARLPTPPQAQQDLLVLTMPAPQGSAAACWVPHFSTGIPANTAGLPQECLLTTASVTGTSRKQEREREKGEKGNTVIKKQRCHIHTVILTNLKTYSWLIFAHLSWSLQHNTTGNVTWAETF